MGEWFNQGPLAQSLNSSKKVLFFRWYRRVIIFVSVTLHIAPLCVQGSRRSDRLIRNSNFDNQIQNVYQLEKLKSFLPKKKNSFLIYCVYLIFLMLNSIEKCTAVSYCT